MIYKPKFCCRTGFATPSKTEEKKSEKMKLIKLA